MHLRGPCSVVGISVSWVIIEDIFGAEIGIVFGVFFL